MSNHVLYLFTLHFAIFVQGAVTASPDMNTDANTSTVLQSGELDGQTLGLASEPKKLAPNHLLLRALAARQNRQQRNG